MKRTSVQSLGELSPGFLDGRRQWPWVASNLGRQDPGASCLPTGDQYRAGRRHTVLVEARRKWSCSDNCYRARRINAAVLLGHEGRLVRISGSLVPRNRSEADKQFEPFPPGRPGRNRRGWHRGKGGELGHLHGRYGMKGYCLLVVDGLEHQRTATGHLPGSPAGPARRRSNRREHAHT